MTSPSAGVLSISSSTVFRWRRAAITSEPYSTNEPSSQSSAMFSRTVRWPVFRRRATAPGRAASSVFACRATTSARSGRRASRSISSSADSAARSSDVSSMKARAWPSKTVSPRVTAIARTIPLTRAWITCSIFIASMTSTSSPARTVSPSRTVTLTIVPCMGAGTGTCSPAPPSRRAIAPSSERASGPSRRHVVRRAGAALLPRARTASGIVRIDPGADAPRRGRRLEEQAPVGRRVRPEQLAHVLLDEARVKPAGQELRMTQQALEERGIGRHARDLELAERAVRLGGHGRQSAPSARRRSAWRAANRTAGWSGSRRSRTCRRGCPGPTAARRR